MYVFESVCRRHGGTRSARGLLLIQIMSDKTAIVLSLFYIQKIEIFVDACPIDICTKSYYNDVV